MDWRYRRKKYVLSSQIGLQEGDISWMNFNEFVCSNLSKHAVSWDTRFSSLAVTIKQHKFSVLYCHQYWQKFYVFFFCEQMKVKMSSYKKNDRSIPTGFYLFNVNNGNTRAICEICLKLTGKTPKRWQWFWCPYC